MCILNVWKYGLISGRCGIMGLTIKAIAIDSCLLGPYIYNFFFSFMMYSAYSRIGKGSLVLKRHSTSHFSPNSWHFFVLSGGIRRRAFTSTPEQEERIQ